MIAESGDAPIPDAPMSDLRALPWVMGQTSEI